MSYQHFDDSPGGGMFDLIDQGNGLFVIQLRVVKMDTNHPGDSCSACHQLTLCRACGVCHSCEAQTQKVIGITKWQVPHPLIKIRTSRILSVQCKALPDWARVWGDTPEMFARPCPIRPRHGFVESRLVKSPAHLLEIVEETRQADPEGEVMLLPFYPAEANALWTPTLLTIGKGHAGATAAAEGNNILMLPLAGAFDPAPFAPCKIADGEVPYIEAVAKEGEATLITQVRSGCAAGGSRDYVPVPTHVEEVISVCEDLCKWEGIMEAAASRPGVVVYHPHGTITDHATVHARSRKIPVVTFAVAKGDDLEATPEAPPPDPKAVLAGLVWGDRIDIANLDHAQLVNMILYGLHHSHALSNEQGKWLGFSTSLLIRLGSMALRGEARHERGRPGVKLAREAIYKEYQNTPISFHRASIHRLINIFRYGHFGSGTSFSIGGFGGMKWAACGLALVPIFNAVRELARDPTEANTNALIRAVNRGVNQAHNGGWWLNKFQGDVSVYTTIAKAAPETLIPLGLFAWRSLGVGTMPDAAQIERRVEKYAKWPVTQVVTPNLIPDKLSAEITPSGLVLTGRARNLPSAIRFVLPLKIIEPALLKSFRVEGGESFSVYRAVDLIEKAGSESDTHPTPTPIWTEPPMQEIDPAMQQLKNNLPSEVGTD